MGRRRGFIFLALGVTLAALVGLVVFALAQGASTSKVAMNDVVVALQDIPDRTIIQAAAVGIRPMPVDTITIGTFTKIEDVIGKMAPSRIFAGEVILSSKIVDSRGQTGLSFMMTKGQVLITFPASNIVGLGLVKPGDSVDVLVTYRPSRTSTPSANSTNADPAVRNVTQSTLQNLKIVTVGSQSATPQASAQASAQTPQQQQQQQQQQAQITSVTFAIEPQDALTLKALKDSEELSIEMVLRAAGDSEVYKTAPVTLKGVLDYYGVR